MDQLINKIKPFAELLDNLTPYVETYHPPWHQEFERISQKQADALDKILIAFEKGSPADLSQELAGGFLSIFKEGKTFLKNESIPYLKRKVTEGVTR